MKATRTWELILVFLLLIVVAGFSATTEGFLDKVAENLKAALPDVG